MNFTTIRGLFFYLQTTLHISNKRILRIIRNNPKFIFQNHQARIRAKVSYLEGQGVEKMVQKGILVKAPEFYMKYFNSNIIEHWNQ